jgi:hypothetical protein
VDSDSKAWAALRGISHAGGYFGRRDVVGTDASSIVNQKCGGVADVLRTEACIASLPWHDLGGVHSGSLSRCA